LVQSAGITWVVLLVLVGSLATSFLSIIVRVAIASPLLLLPPVAICCFNGEDSVLLAVSQRDGGQ
jgi:hypothetical protein